MVKSGLERVQSVKKGLLSGHVPPASGVVENSDKGTKSGFEQVKSAKKGQLSWHLQPGVVEISAKE
jgi:hypothetical protein